MVVIIIIKVKVIITEVDINKIIQTNNIIKTKGTMTVREVEEVTTTTMKVEEEEAIMVETEAAIEVDRKLVG